MMIKNIYNYLFKSRPTQPDTYLVYGVSSQDLGCYTGDDLEESYSFFIVTKFNNRYTSHCGKNIVNITYIEKLY